MKHALALIMFVAVALDAQPITLPVYEVRRAVDTIRIDGKLDEATWALSPRASEIRLVDDPTRRPRFATEATIAWNDASLYVAFSCSDREPWGRMKKHDDHLWEEEVVEVFLDPDGDGQNYAELEVSPNNVVVDLLIPNPQSLTGDNVRSDIAGLQTAVGRHAAGWIAEMAIPWKGLAIAGISAAPKRGDRWRAGLYRIKRPGGAAKADQIAALMSELKIGNSERKLAIEERLQQLRADDEYSAWSVTRRERGFHDPERFGYLRFVD